MTGEADDARMMAQLRDATRDLLLLDAQSLGRKRLVELGVGFRAEAVHEPPEVGVANATVGAIGQVLRRRWLDWFTTLFGEVALEETVFLEMTRAKDHG